MVFISVIIPFNKGKIYLNECLRSLKNQKMENNEIILILNGVEENIEDLINTYSETLPLNIKIFNEEIGVAKARNEGLKIANGKYIYFLDSDDFLYKGTLDNLGKIAKSDENLEMIAGKRISSWYNYDSFHKLFDENRLKEYEKKISDENFPISLIIPNGGGINNISSLNVLIKKEFIIKNEISFDENLRHNSDFSFIIPLIKSSSNITGIKSAFYIKRRRDDPYIPSLNQENKDEKFLRYMESYNHLLNYMGEEKSLKVLVDKKMIKYYFKTFSPKIRRSPEDKWRNEYFEKMSDISKNFDEKSMKWYQKREINALRKKDLKSLKKYLYLRLIFKKLRRFIKHPRIGLIYRNIYMSIFNKMTLNNNMIMFESFRGQFYNDNPKYIYEYLYNHYKNDFKFIWVINNKNNKKEILGSPKTVKRFSLKYYYYMALSKYWVINLRQPLRLRKREDQVILSTWHGTPLKKLGLDIDTIHSADPKIKHHYVTNASQWKYLVSPNKYSTDIFRRVFAYDGEVLEYGYPRNDILYEKNPEIINTIKKKLKLPFNKKIILYAPTWRDDEYYESGQYKFNLKLNLEKLKNNIDNEYIILIRTHYFIADKLDLKDFENFAFNVSYHDDIGELYLISDILITDYSSVFFDFANLKRPILFYTYDLEKYSSSLRGFYIDMKKDLPGPLLFTTEEIIEAIANIDKITNEFKKQYNEFYNRFCYLDDGNASEKISKKVFDL
ncbi:MAG: bifunctional glycosyltransferase family 2 protein/CDP-glycerol:glycerophosphate glycerophosphotransferase [Methanobrevibacter sp.]|nr:bifunctional glycosyltransferase family 2 protein/CDP-glycerol:glycerophosphate glycerophosphotransferase [Methanobrevibacter sp.]